MIDQTLFRNIIGHFASGVTVVTSTHDGRDHGITLSAMTSLSLDPPMLLICVNKTMPTHAAIQRSGAFVANVLADHQGRLARQFARPAPDKFHNVATTRSALGPAVLRGALAHFECRVAGEADGRTHTIFLGEVQEAHADDSRAPLLYYRADFGRFESPSTPRTSVPHYVPAEPADELVGAGPFRLGIFYAS